MTLFHKTQPTNVKRAGAAVQRAFKKAAEKLIAGEDARVREHGEIVEGRATFLGTTMSRYMLAHGMISPRYAITNGHLSLDWAGSEDWNWLKTTRNVQECAGGSWDREEVGIDPEVVQDFFWVHKLHNGYLVNAVLLNAALRWVGNGAISITQTKGDRTSPLVIRNQDTLGAAVLMPIRP